MTKRFMIGFFTFVLLLFYSHSAYAAPSNLNAVPFSDEENDWGVELSWTKGDGDGSYDVWLSRNGIEWDKLVTVSDNTYKVGKNKIDLYVNYYFIVTLSSAGIENPLTGSNLDEENPDATDIAVAFPPGGGVHGNYKNNTNACAKCHRTHDGAAPSLLITTTINDTCMTCHDGTQSKYDVLQGQVKTNSTEFLTSASGPFGKLGVFSSVYDIKLASYDTVSRKYTVADRPGPWLSGYKATTPKQYWTQIYVVPKGTVESDVYNSDDWKYSSITAWNDVLQINYEEGSFKDNENLIDNEEDDVYIQFSPIVDKDNNGNPDTIPDVMSIHSVTDNVYVGQALKNPRNDGEWGKPFGCGSCHQVHTQEYDSDTDSYSYLGGNYRMIARKLPANSDVRVLAFAETLTNRENIYYRSGMNQFCLGCHSDYYESVQDETYGYVTMGESNTRHKVGVSSSVYAPNPNPVAPNFRLPLEGSVTEEVYYADNKIMCLTCHNAHGSNSTYENPPGTFLPNSLLKRNNDGVCVDCHGASLPSGN